MSRGLWGMALLTFAFTSTRAANAYSKMDSTSQYPLLCLPSDSTCPVKFADMAEIIYGDLFKTSLGKNLAVPEDPGGGGDKIDMCDFETAEQNTMCREGSWSRLEGFPDGVTLLRKLLGSSLHINRYCG